MRDVRLVLRWQPDAMPSGMFMNGYECKGPTSTVMEFFNLMPSWGKRIHVNGECVEKQCTSAKELHVPK